jgi:hypothetical protein
MTATLPDKPRPAALQDILYADEPYRTHWLTQWMSEFDYEHGGTVLMKTHSGRSLSIKMEDGQVINIAPRGRRVAREVALQLMDAYGLHGKYTGVDRATGISRNQLAAFHPDTKKAFEDYSFNFVEDYVLHVPDLPGVEEDIEQGENEPNG